MVGRSHRGGSLTALTRSFNRFFDRLITVSLLHVMGWRRLATPAPPPAGWTAGNRAKRDGGDGGDAGRRRVAAVRRFHPGVGYSLLSRSGGATTARTRPAWRRAIGEHAWNGPAFRAFVLNGVLTDPCSSARKLALAMNTAREPLKKR